MPNLNEEIPMFRPFSRIEWHGRWLGVQGVVVLASFSSMRPVH